MTLEFNLHPLWHIQGLEVQGEKSTMDFAIGQQRRALGGV